MISLTFITPDGTEIPVETNTGTSLMEAARAANVPGVLAECGGACSCSTCHVYIEGDWPAQLPQIDENEADLLDFAFEPDPQRSRLACQIMLSDALDGMRARVPSQQG